MKQLVMMATKRSHTSTARKTKLTDIKILERLEVEYEGAECALHHETPFQLLIATILSAQCTDERVNQVTPTLFKKYGDAKKLAKAPIDDLEKLINSTGFYKNKAKNIKACAEMLVQRFKNELPRTIEELILLPGVGRKTANVLLGNAFQIPSGIVVDTHVLRLSNRFGWISTENAEKAEVELIQKVPQKNWIAFSHWMIHHGRQLCKARKPNCKDCFLNDVCPSAENKLTLS